MAQATRKLSCKGESHLASHIIEGKRPKARLCMPWLLRVFSNSLQDIIYHEFGMLVLLH